MLQLLSVYAAISAAFRQSNMYRVKEIHLWHLVTLLYLFSQQGIYENEGSSCSWNPRDFKSNHLTFFFNCFLRCLTNLVWLLDSPHDHEKNSNSIDNNTSVIIARAFYKIFKWWRWWNGGKWEQDFVSERRKKSVYEKGNRRAFDCSKRSVEHSPTSSVSLCVVQRKTARR